MKRYYETIFIIHPALETSRLKEIITENLDRAEKAGGSILTTEVWGRRRLAYQIDKQKYGTYILFQFSGEKIDITDMNVEMEHDANILAYFSIRIEESGLREQKADLDTQIAGTVAKDDSSRSSEVAKPVIEPKTEENEEKPVDDQEILKEAKDVEEAKPEPEEEPEKPEEPAEPSES